jgi:hypothetical protein
MGSAELGVIDGFTPIDPRQVVGDNGVELMAEAPRQVT